MGSRGNLCELGYCGFCPQERQEKNVPLSVHWKKISMVRDLQTVTCEDKLKDLVLFLPGTRRVGRQVKEEVKAL